MNPESPQLPSTLFVTRDEQLAKPRIRLLQGAGCLSIPCEPKDVAVLLGEFQFDTLILCNSLPHEDKWNSIAVFKTKYPRGRVVSVVSEPESIDADVRLHMPVMPSDWLSLGQVLHRR